MHDRINAASFHSLRHYGARLEDDPDALPSDELFRKAREVKGTMESPGWRTIMELVDEAKEYNVFLLTADHRDHAQMARLAGMVEGVRAAEMAARAVLERDVALRKQLDDLAGSAVEEEPAWS